MFNKIKKSHYSDGVLWQYHLNELNQADSREVADHLKSCAACRAKLIELERLIQVMQTAHHRIKPDWAQQLRMLHVLHKAVRVTAIDSIWVDQSKRLLRWLIPSVALLLIAFLLVKPTAKSTPTYWSELLMATPESRLLFPQSEKQMKEDVYELLVSHYQN